MRVSTARSGAACGDQPRPSADACAQRRARVASMLGPDEALVLSGGTVHTRSNDTEFRFRPDSDFYYLTGLADPDAVLVLRPGHEPEFTVFVRPKDASAEVWSGRRVGPELASERFGADAAYSRADLGSELPALLDGVRRVHLPLEDAALQRRVLKARTTLQRRNRTGAMPPDGFTDARVTVGEDRINKDAASLASLRRAIDITVAGHEAVQRSVRAGMHEFEIEARLEYEFRRRGASGTGYGSIVGSGANATILHYVDNDGPLHAGELLLVDAGAEFDLHSGDLTRTFPVSGSFSPAQRDLYAVCLEANVAGIADTRVGQTIETIHATCLRVLCQGLIDMKLCEGSVDALLESEDYKRYYMHRTSHWLGVDVHDAGYYSLEGTPRPLRPGYVLTVEPGLYVSADDDRAPQELRGTGIRIEDDILVTDGDPEVLTAASPKTPDAIEALMAQGRAD
ncbi:MAG: aminopeptidase P N-terminal domain-containing protein [Nannocystaceae bacterium]|nr:aminopeptidase P N-terminal domain-containing protein [Nannocystaceae bacterium]